MQIPNEHLAVVRWLRAKQTNLLAELAVVAKHQQEAMKELSDFISGEYSVDLLSEPWSLDLDSGELKHDVPTAGNAAATGDAAPNA